MILSAVVEKEFRMFFRYPLRVISSILVGIVFLLPRESLAVHGREEVR